MASYLCVILGRVRSFRAGSLRQAVEAIKDAVTSPMRGRAEDVPHRVVALVARVRVHVGHAANVSLEEPGRRGFAACDRRPHGDPVAGDADFVSRSPDLSVALDPDGKRVGLSEAELDACARALKEAAGVREVRALTAARVVAPPR